MIVSKANGTVVSSGGLQDTKTFQIRTNGHAFRMLSSGLYSDKIAAVVREIGCNASDAHIAGGTPSKPIEVKLPNGIDPQFYIKDYGIGLDHDEVMGLYSTYFASTKQQSNEMTGAFGLGSKSPFSYTDSFSVTACKDGKRRIYSAHIGEDDTPTVALMHEEDIPTDDTWTNGVMVGFPVKKEDISTFHKRAQQVYKYFPVAPEILGGDPIKPLKILQDYTSFAFVEDLPANIVVVMGGVMYPVEVSSLNIPSSNPLYFAFLSMSNLMLRTPIGRVQVAASREQLQFDENTRKYLIEELEKVLKMVVTDLAKEALACHTWKEKCDYVKKAKDTRGISVSVELLKKFNIPQAEKIMALYTAWHQELPVPAHGTVRQAVIEESARSEPANPLVGFKIKSARTSTEYSWGNHVGYNDITIVSGTEDRPLVRIREAMKDGRLSGTIVYVGVTDHKNPNTKGHEAALKKLQETLVGVPVLKLGDYDAPPLKKSSRSKKKAATLNDGEIVFQGAMTKVTDVPKKNRVYIRMTAGGSRGIDRMHTKVGDIIQEYDWNNTIRAVSVVSNKLKFPIESPVALKISDLKRVDIHKRADWKHFDDYLKETLESKEFQKAVETYVGSYKYTVNLGPDPYGHNASSDFIDLLVWFRAKSDKWTTHFAPIIQKHGMLDTVEEIYKNSLLPAVPLSHEISSTLDRINTLSHRAGVALSLPEFTGKDVTAFKKKLEAASHFDKEGVTELLKLYPNSFSMILDEVLTRGN